MNPRERIQNVRGATSDASRWKLTQPAAIQGIEEGRWNEGRWNLYVERPQGGDSVEVIVAVSPYTTST